MKELMAKYGIKRGPMSLQAAERISEPTSPTNLFSFPTMATIGMNAYIPRRLKRRPADLIMLSESPIPSRAIRLIRNGITSMTYGLQPIDVMENRGSKKDRFKNSIKTVRDILNHPNTDDDDFMSFLGQIVEDILVFDAGCWEYVEKPAYIERNPTLALEVVPGYTIAKNKKWKGDPKMPRYVQVLDDGRTKGEFLTSQIEYISHRKRSFDPFGLSPLETALEIMDGIINVMSYQKTVASEAYPAAMLYLGDNCDDDQRALFKMYWENELRGRGTPGFFGGMGETAPQVLDLKPNGDSGLFLGFTDLYIRIFAICFDLHPFDFGTERDVNYNTANVSANASVQEARRPIAQMIASKINAHLLPRISKLTNDPLINELEFFWTDLAQRDMKLQAEIDNQYAANDAMTIDEMRSNLNLDPLPLDLGKLTPTAFKAVTGIDPLILLRKDINDLLDTTAVENTPPANELNPPPGQGQLTPEEQAILDEQSMLNALRSATAKLRRIK